MAEAKQSESELGIKGGPSTTKTGVLYPAPLAPAMHPDEYAQPATAVKGGEANTFPGRSGEWECGGQAQAEEGILACLGGARRRRRCRRRCTPSNTANSTPVASTGPKSRTGNRRSRSD